MEHCWNMTQFSAHHFTQNTSVTSYMTDNLSNYGFHTLILKSTPAPYENVSLVLY